MESTKDEERDVGNLELEDERQLLAAIKSIYMRETAYNNGGRACQNQSGSSVPSSASKILV